MPPVPPTTRVPWEDRWNVPTLDQLLDPVEEVRERILRDFLDAVRGLGEVELERVWHGSSWRWTIEARLTAEVTHKEEGERPVLAYAVCYPEAPLVVVPLTDHQMRKLPIRRLNRVVRENLRLAKRSVDLHWGHFNPSNNVDLEHLIDLVKRKHKMLQQPVEA